MLSYLASDQLSSNVASGTPTKTFVYDGECRLLAEHNAATGGVLREYVWTGLMSVAFIDHSGGSPATYYVRTDQVFRP